MGLLKTLGTCIIGWEGLFRIIEFEERESMYEKANQYAHSIGKPLLVIGEPRGRHPCGDVCVDIIGCPTCKTSVKANIENLETFEDKQFGASFVSHVLEHINRPDLAWDELNRTSDKVFVAYPRSYRLLSRLHPEHKWLVKKRDGGFVMTKNWGSESIHLEGV